VIGLTDELAALLLELGAAHIELAMHPTDAGRLRHRPPGLPPAIVAKLRTHRAALLSLLRGGYVPVDAEAVYVFHERLGIGDELAMPTGTGSPAWLIAVGESALHVCTRRTMV